MHAHISRRASIELNDADIDTAREILRLAYLQLHAQPAKSVHGPVTAIIGCGLDYRPDEHERGEFRNEPGVCLEYADGYRDCFYLSELTAAKQAQPEPTHKYEFELPDGDSRQVKCCWAERIQAGNTITHKLCLAVSRQAQPEPPEEHRLSLSYQIRRAIKAEDALRVAQKEIENLNGLLNATYVSREAKEKQYDEALCTVAEQRDTMKLRIRQHLANRYAYMFKEFCEELEGMLYAAPIPQQPAPSVPEGWKHDCGALCVNGVELWIDRCPHCGKPRQVNAAAPQPEEPK